MLPVSTTGARKEKEAEASDLRYETICHLVKKDVRSRDLDTFVRPSHKDQSNNQTKEDAHTFT